MDRMLLYGFAIGTSHKVFHAEWQIWDWDADGGAKRMREDEKEQKRKRKTDRKRDQKERQSILILAWMKPMPYMYDFYINGMCAPLYMSYRHHSKLNESIF